MPGKIGVGIDVGSTAIKLVRILLKEDQTQLLELHHFPLPGGVDNLSGDTAQHFKSFLRERKSKITGGIAGISGEHLNIRYLRVPVSSLHNMEKIIAADMQEIMEKAATRLLYGYLPLQIPRGGPKQEQLIAIAIARNNFLDTIYDFFKQAGIRIHYFVPNALALYHAFIKFAAFAEKEIVCVADIGHDNIDVAIVADSNLYFLRNINNGLQAITEVVSKDKQLGLAQAQEYKHNKVDVTPSLATANQDDGENWEHESFEEKILFAAQAIPDSLEASLKFAKLQTRIADLEMERLSITGGAVKQLGIFSLLKSRFACPAMPIELASDLTLTPACELDKKLRASHRYWLALGLAHLTATGVYHSFKLESSKQQIRNLIFGKRLFEYASVVLAALLAVIAIGLALTSSYYYEGQKRHLQEKHRKLQEKSQQFRSLHKKNRMLRNKLLTLTNNACANRHVLRIFSWLYDNLPAQMYLTQLQFLLADNGKTQLCYQGIIVEASQDVHVVLNNFLKAIREHPQLKVIEEKDPRQKEGKLYFELHMEVVNLP